MLWPVQFTLLHSRIASQKGKKKERHGWGTSGQWKCRWNSQQRFVIYIMSRAVISVGINSTQCIQTCHIFSFYSTLLIIICQENILVWRKLSSHESPCLAAIDFMIIWSESEQHKTILANNDDNQILSRVLKIYVPAGSEPHRLFLHSTLKVVTGACGNIKTSKWAGLLSRLQMYLERRERSWD